MAGGTGLLAVYSAGRCGMMLRKRGAFMQEQGMSNKARMIGYAIGFGCLVAVVAWRLVVR